MKFPTLLECLTKHNGSDALENATPQTPQWYELAHQEVCAALVLYSQPLELSQFIAVGEDGKPMKPPTAEELADPDGPNQYVWDWAQANERVLFSGWELLHYGEKHRGLLRYNLEGSGHRSILVKDLPDFSTVNNFVTYEQEFCLPTQSAKQILNIKEA